MLPDGWTKETIGERVVIKHGFAFASNHFNSAGVGYRLLTPGHFLEEGGFHEIGDKQKFFSGPIPNGYLLKKHDLLVVMTEQAPGLLGSSALIPEDNVYLHNQRLGLVQILNTEITSRDFVFHLFNVEYVRKHISDAAGGTKVRHSSPDKIQSVPALFPPKTEQENVAKILDAWDRGIRQLSDLIAAKLRFKQGLMQQLLTGRRRFKEFKEQWSEHQLGDLFKEREETNRTNLPLLSITAERGVVPRQEIERKDTSSENKSLYKRIAPGDIGYNTMRMWQGVSAMSSLEGIVSPAYTICIPRPAINAKFAAYLFKYPPVVHQFFRHSQGLVDDTLSLKFHHFAQIHVHVPSVEEQLQIVEVFQSADREIGLLRKKLDAIKTQKKGLMQKLLTGQVRVASGGR